MGVTYELLKGYLPTTISAAGQVSGPDAFILSQVYRPFFPTDAGADSVYYHGFGLVSEPSAG